MKTRYSIWKNVSIPPKEVDGEWDWTTERLSNYHNELALPLVIEELRRLDDDNDTYFIVVQNWVHIAEGIYDWESEDDAVYPYMIEEKFSQAIKTIIS